MQAANFAARELSIQEYRNYSICAVIGIVVYIAFIGYAHPAVDEGQKPIAYFVRFEKCAVSFVVLHEGIYSSLDLLGVDIYFFKSGELPRVKVDGETI